MKLYSYHPETGKLLGDFFPLLDPLEAVLSEEAGKEPDKYLIPSNSTAEVPPASLGLLEPYWDLDEGGWYLSAPDVEEPVDEETGEIDYLQQPMDRLTFWLAAADIGVSKRGVLARVDELEDSPDKFRAYAYIEEASQYRREDPLLIAFAAAEGITEEQLDHLWVWALTPPQ